ncbi:conserved uncharacterized protein, partial [Ustilago hordei]
MAEETKPQASASNITKRSKRGRKLLKPVPKLTSQNYYDWSTHVRSFLQSVPNAIENLEGTYNDDHLRWRQSFNLTLTNAVQGTINMASKKIEKRLGSEATRNSGQLALITQLGDIKMFHANARKLIQEIRAIQAEDKSDMEPGNVMPLSAFPKIRHSPNWIRKCGAPSPKVSQKLRRKIQNEPRSLQKGAWATTNSTDVLSLTQPRPLQKAARTTANSTDVLDLGCYKRWPGLLQRPWVDSMLGWLPSSNQHHLHCINQDCCVMSYVQCPICTFTYVQSNILNHLCKKHATIHISQEVAAACGVVVCSCGQAASNVAGLKTHQGMRHCQPAQPALPASPLTPPDIAQQTLSPTPETTAQEETTEAQAQDVAAVSDFGMELSQGQKDSARECAKLINGSHGNVAQK